MTLHVWVLGMVAVTGGLTVAGSVQAEAYCREYQRRVTIGGTVQDSYGTACLQPDGAWRIAQESAPQGMGDADYAAALVEEDLAPVVVYREPVFVERRVVYSRYPAYPAWGVNVSWRDGDGWRDGHGHRGRGHGGERHHGGHGRD